MVMVMVMMMAREAVFVITMLLNGYHLLRIIEDAFFMALI